MAGGLNLYGFAGGDPVNFSDPFGLCPENKGGDGKNDGLGNCPVGSAGFREWVQMSSGAVADAGLADPYLWAGGIASGVRAVAVRGAAAASSAGGNIGFGHGARHLIGTGLKVSEVEGAIASEIGSMVGPSTLTGSFWGRVLVNGQRLEYRAYTLKPVR